MPNVPATAKRTLRVSDDLWTDARHTADQVGETITDAITRFLREYVANPPASISVALTTCPACGRDVGRRGGGGNVLADHKNADGLWCPGEL